MTATHRLLASAALVALLAGCAPKRAGLDEPTKAEINRRAENTATDARVKSGDASR